MQVLRQAGRLVGQPRGSEREACKRCLMALVSDVVVCGASPGNDPRPSSQQPASRCRDSSAHTKAGSVVSKVVQVTVEEGRRSLPPSLTTISSGHAPGSAHSSPPQPSASETPCSHAAAALYLDTVTQLLWARAEPAPPDYASHGSAGQSWRESAASAVSCCVEAER